MQSTWLQVDYDDAEGIASREDFRELTARYSITNREDRIVVAIRDSRGRRRVREYVGSPARRVRVLDRLGRIRTK